MANYYGTARTNYFAVKDGKAFEEEMAGLPVELITEKTEDGETLYGFLDASSDGSGLDWYQYDEETEEDTEIDWPGVLARHLKDGSVAVFMEVGAEKYRYLTGVAWAVNSKGEQRHINLERDIMEMASALGDTVTSPQY